MSSFTLRKIFSILSLLVVLWIDYVFARGGRKGGAKSRPGSRMKKKICCGGIGGIDSSKKSLPDWMIAIFVFLVLIVLYVIYALMRWIYIKQLQGRVFRYRHGIDQREMTSDAPTNTLTSPSYVWIIDNKPLKKHKSLKAIRNIIKTTKIN